MAENFKNYCKATIATKLNCSIDDVFEVWFSKTLHHCKGLYASFSKEGKGKYFECTFNGISKELYIDEYYKHSNEMIKVDFTNYS